MKISVVIPVRNTERYLAESIESVLGQTRPAEQVVVVDDGATDQTPAILEKFVPRILVVRQAHLGSACALNAGIARATGDHIAFHDADDIWLPGKLMKQCAMLSNEPALDAGFCMVRQFVSPDWLGEMSDDVARHHDQPGIAKIAMLIRRHAFERIGPFDEAYRTIDFLDWYGRAVTLGLCMNTLPEVLVLRRVHASNTGLLQRAAQREENLRSLKSKLNLARCLGRAPAGLKTK